jgi:hypothetical protein
MGIIAKQVRDTKEVASHAENIVNELLIVFISTMNRQLKTFSENTLQNTTLMACSRIWLFC